MNVKVSCYTNNALHHMHALYEISLKQICKTNTIASIFNRKVYRHYCFKSSWCNTKHLSESFIYSHLHCVL